MKTKLLILACLMVLLSGCVGPTVTKSIQALGDDQATVTLNVVSAVYGTVRLVRTNPGTNSTVTVSPDGSVTITRP